MAAVRLKETTTARRMSIGQLLSATVLCTLILVACVECQIINRTPHFIPSSGDMSRFSLPENTPVGSVVYQLR
ncbi:hypothetical protein pipiens_014507, partial [Culex pipiens pipiens]